jgi:hypothetical protein
MRSSPKFLQALAAWLSAGVALSGIAAEAGVATFDELPLTPNSYWNGSDLSGTHQVADDPWYPGSTMDLYHSTFASGNASFNNNYNATYYSWDGWAYSNRTDNANGGFDPNTYQLHGEYTSITGSGKNSTNYAVGYVAAGGPPTITFTSDVSVQGAYFTNTAYEVPSVHDGIPGFSKKFGGASGSDPDWFLLTVTGKDSGGATLGAVDMYLADYRSTDNFQDYIVQDWTWLDLTSLGANVRSLEFRLSSSDTDPVWGMNTPAYFAMDTLTVTPEPSTLALSIAGLTAALAWRWRRRKN